MAKVSVIIPVYGVEKYVERCARSLFEQTLDDIEYLFIDDCSPDKSIDIIKKVLEDYPNRMNQVIFHRMGHNSGQAAVRKWGIQNVTGDYTIHCDSDDWVKADMYETMYNAAIAQNADVVVCDYTEFGVDWTRNKIAFPKLRGDLDNKLRSWDCAGQIWNKLFKTSIYHKDIIIPENNMGEDMAWVYQMLYYCKKVVYIQRHFYQYYVNEDSICRVKDPEKIYSNFLQTCANARIVTDFYLSHSTDIDTLRVVDRTRYQERDKIVRIIKTDKKYRYAWKTSFPDLNWRIIFHKEFSIREKIKTILILIGIY